MDFSPEQTVVVLLMDGDGNMLPYQIADVFRVANRALGVVGTYTVMTCMSIRDAEPVIVRNGETDTPSFIGIEDEDELRLVASEYEARQCRRRFTVI